MPCCIDVLYLFIVLFCVCNFRVIFLCCISSRVNFLYYIFVFYFSFCEISMLYYYVEISTCRTFVPHIFVVLFRVCNFCVICFVLIFPEYEIFVLYFHVIFSCYISNLIIFCCLILSSIKIILLSAITSSAIHLAYF